LSTRNTEVQKLDDKEKAIRNYLLENPGTTANKVATYMQTQKLLSRDPTLKRISNLESRGIIEDHKEGNSFHRLYVIDKTQFDLIYRELVQIEGMVDAVHSSIQSHRMAGVKIVPIPEEPHLGSEILMEFNTQSYVEMIYAMLRVLLLWTHSQKMSDADKRLLYQKITQAMIRLDIQFYNLPTAKKLLALNKSRLYLRRQKLSRLTRSKQSELNIDKVDNLIKKIHAFPAIIAKLQAFPK
jgi:DNA-binding Lrp family transcriptional regulator